MLLAIVVLLAVPMTVLGGRAMTAPTWNPQVSVASSATFSSGSGATDWHGRINVVTRADGVKVGVYRVASGHNTNDAALHVRFKPVGGAWTTANTKIGGGAVTGFPMNPPVGNISYGEGYVFVAPNGDLVLEMWSVSGISPTGTLNGTYQSRSTDGGESWSAPAAVTFAGNPHADLATMMTDDAFVVDQTIYMGARFYQQLDGDPSASLLMKSTDNAASWSYVSTIQGVGEGGSGGQEVGLVYLGHSTIMAALRDNPHTNAYQRFSTDMGLTWGALQNVTSQIGIAARQRVYTRMELQGEPGGHRDPVLVMSGFVHQTSGSSQPRRNCIWIGRFIRSELRVQWSGPFYVDSTTADAGYGDIYWDPAIAKFVTINYQGTLSAAILKEYVLDIDFETGEYLAAA